MCPNSTFVVVCRLGLNIEPKRLRSAPPFDRDAAADRLPRAKHQPAPGAAGVLQRVLRECSGGPGTVLGVVLPRGLLKQSRPFGLCAGRASNGQGRVTTMDDEP